MRPGSHLQIAEPVKGSQEKTQPHSSHRSADSSAIDDSLAYDLHDGPSQLFVVMNLLAHRYLEELPSDSRWSSRLARLADLSEEGKWQMDQIARGLLTRPVIEDGLPKALSELTKRFQADSGVVTRLSIRGTPREIEPPEEEALHRVTHLALVNAWKHARCGLVSVELALELDVIDLKIMDDGIGLGRRWDERRCRLGFVSMRRTMQGVGGTFRVRRASPHGVKIHARIPQSAEA